MAMNLKEIEKFIKEALPDAKLKFKIWLVMVIIILQQ